MRVPVTFIWFRLAAERYAVDVARRNAQVCGINSADAISCVANEGSVLERRWGVGDDHRKVGTAGTNAHPALVVVRMTSAIGMGKSKDDLHSPHRPNSACKLKEIPAPERGRRVRCGA